MSGRLGQTLAVCTVLGCMCSIPSCVLAPVNSLLRYLACVVIYPSVKLTIPGVLGCVPGVRVLLQTGLCVGVVVTYCVLWWLWPGRDRVYQLLKPTYTVQKCLTGWQSLVEYTRRWLGCLMYQQGSSTWSDAQWLWYSPGAERTLSWRPYQYTLLSPAVWRPSYWKQVPRNAYLLNVRVNSLIWRVTSYHVKQHFRIWLVVLEWMFCRFISNQVLKRAGPHLNVLKEHKFKFLLIRKLPLRALSRLWGRTHRINLPVWLRPYACKLYIRMFSCNLEEAQITDLTHYANLSEWFRRSLKPHLRPIDKSHCLTSPADGRVLYCGPVENGNLEQIKNVTYSLSHFIGQDLNFTKHFHPRQQVHSSHAEHQVQKGASEMTCDVHTDFFVSTASSDCKYSPSSDKASQPSFTQSLDKNSLCNLTGQDVNKICFEREPFSELQERFDGTRHIQIQTVYSKHPIPVKSGDADYQVELEEHVIEQTIAIEEGDIEAFTKSMAQNQGRLMDDSFLQDGMRRECLPPHILEACGPSQLEEQFSRRLLVDQTHVLHQCIVYLAPGDYHRFHSPADWTVFTRRHFPGYLFSVNPSIASWLQGLFSINERVMYTGRWKYGFFSMTPVGATNVGTIDVFFDKKLKTNCDDVDLDQCSYTETSFRTREQAGVHLKRGQLMGEFNLGSTIVLLFEAPRDFKLRINPGDKVKYGQGMVSLNHNKQKHKRKHNKW